MPFIITSAWSFTAATVDGFPITDYSYINMLLKKGAATLAVVAPDGEVTKTEARFYEGPVPSGRELAELIENQIHTRQFRHDADVRFEYRRLGTYKLHFERRVVKVDL